MAIEQQNGDYDIKTSAATVFNKTADAATAGPWELDIRIGNGTKNLHTNEASLTIAMTVAGETVNGGSASVAKDAGILRARLSTPRVHVAAGEAITVTLLSNNVNDADVDVTVTPRRSADVTAAGHMESEPQSLGSEAAQQVSVASRGRRVLWVDYSIGSDDNDGLSLLTAVKTWTGLGAILAAGDEVIITSVSDVSNSLDLTDFPGVKLVFLPACEFPGGMTLKLGHKCQVFGGEFGTIDTMNAQLFDIHVEGVDADCIDLRYAKNSTVRNNRLSSASANEHLIYAHGRIERNLGFLASSSESTVYGIRGTGIILDNGMIVSGTGTVRALGVWSDADDSTIVRGGQYRATSSGGTDVYVSAGIVQLENVNYLTSGAAEGASVIDKRKSIKDVTDKFHFTPDERAKCHAPA